MRKVETTLVCDITGDPAQETVRFAVRDRAYEIDLSAEALADFEAAVAGFVESARLIGRMTVVVKGGGNGRVRVDREQVQAMRRWAKTHGYAVSDRGRLPADVVAKYHAGVAA